MWRQTSRMFSMQSTFIMGSGFGVLLLLLLISSLFTGSGQWASTMLNLGAMVAVVVGIAGVYVYLARHLHWWLPALLHAPEEEKDRNWRVLVLSLIVIGLPLIAIWAEHLVKR